MSFPRYPKYKPSGVEWLPEVPAHWEVKRLRFAAPLVTERAGTRSNPVALENIEGWTGKLVPTETQFEGEGTQFRPGDILFGKLRPYLAKIHLAACAGEAVGDFHVVRPTAEVYGRFLQHAMLRREFIDIIDGTTFGSKMPRASWEALGGMPTALPPLPEQRAIAAFLDRETAKIDGLVDEQRRLVELLKEKRQAVVSHAVTKGLDPKAPMKPSGVEWLGDVPAHWEVVRNKAIFAEFDERSEDDDGELLTVSHLTGVTRRAEKDVNMFLAETLAGYKRCERGDLVINTMWAWMGALGVSPLAGLVSPSYNVYRPRLLGRLDPAYFDALCRIAAYRTEMKARSTGVWESRLRLYPDAFLDMRLPLPPSNEQRRIADWIAEGTTKWDQACAEAERSITLLQERRSALISAAVTGQIDVRNAATTEAA